MSAEGIATWRKNRAKLHDSIQDCAAPSDDDLIGSAGATGAVLTHWVLVAEFVDTNGEAWLARRNSENMTQWLREGMLNNALGSETWQEDRDVEEEE